MEWSSASPSIQHNQDRVHGANYIFVCVCFLLTKLYSVLVIPTNDDATIVKYQATPTGEFSVDTHQPDQIK
jgi:hypothetical protein